jgi:sec-independent protein translocase protein TatB
MFDFSFGELAVIGAVALVVLGPERLPKVARSVGEWAGKAQRYVSQVKADINREIELAELKKLQEQAREVARSIEASVQDGVAGMQSELNATAKTLSTGFEDPAAGSSASAATGSSYSWEGAGDWETTRFFRRYKPGPSVDELAEEITKLRRQLALPETSGHPRHKYAPRARLNRPRIRR